MKHVLRLTKKKVLLLFLLISLSLFLTLLTPGLLSAPAPQQHHVTPAYAIPQLQLLLDRGEEKQEEVDVGFVEMIDWDALVDPVPGPLPVNRPAPVPTSCRTESKGCSMVYNNCSSKNRVDSVRLAFEHAWRGYRAHAWGKDTLKPLTLAGEVLQLGGMGLSIVEGLGALRLMGLTELEAEAEQWVKNDYKFSYQSDVSVFEVTTRVIAGFLEMYYLTGKSVYLEKAGEMGALVGTCYTSPGSVPNTRLDLRRIVCKPPSGCRQNHDCWVSTAEVATTSLELRALSLSVRNLAYFTKVNATSNMLLLNAPKDGLVPGNINKKNWGYQVRHIFINFTFATSATHNITLIDPTAC